MSARAWFALIFLSGGVGSLCGWTGRVLTIRDAIQTAAAEAYLAERDYYNKQADAIIAEAKPKKGAHR